MSELINTNDNRATIRWKLLTGASALALTAYVSSVGSARAEEADKPLLWVELGGQMEMMQGTSSPFIADFMLITPTPGTYQNGSPIENQKPPRFAFGGEGKITFQPENSDWIFSGAIRYGRSHGNRHVHHQSPALQYVAHSGTAVHTFYKYAAAFTDTKSLFNERHTVLDFSVGKDVGLGILGRQGQSTISAGVRFAQFSANSSLDVQARPTLVPHSTRFFPVPKYITWDQHALSAHAMRSFNGVGPALSWNASATLLGDTREGELTLDWGINAAALFGRQKAKTDHITRTLHRYHNSYPLIHQSSNSAARSRSVTVPNVGGFAGLSYRYSDAKISIGYRYDTFLNAMDTGIDAMKKSNLTFHGPYASISIGLGD